MKRDNKKDSNNKELDNKKSSQLLCINRHTPKILHNRSGLVTLKCLICKRLLLQEYIDNKALENIKKEIKLIQDIHFRRIGSLNI